MKLRAPVKTVLSPDFLDSQEAFCERITGNYMQIGQYLTDTDMLHLVSKPPELFVAGSDITGIFNSTDIENNQIQKTKIINNLINRIIISADGSLSYQDNVYITNILKQLGIKNEKKFMREIYRLTKETKEQHEKIDLYWNNLTELKELVSEISETEKIRDKADRPALDTAPLYLHEEVYNRLQTGAIYRIMQNFISAGSGGEIVTNESYMISEQSRVSREILLSKLREEVRGEKAQLYYHRENIYESDESSFSEISVNDINERITSAVLINLIDNIYESVYDKINHNKNTWLNTESAYYGAAENTLFRIEENTAYLQQLHERFISDEESYAYENNELSMLHYLTDIKNSPDMIWDSTYITNAFSPELVQRYSEITANTEINEERFNNSDLIYNEGKRTDISLGFENVNSKTETNLYESRQNDTYNNTFDYSDTKGPVNTQITQDRFEKADITHITEEGDTFTDNTLINEGDTLKERVERTYSQNIIRNMRYMQNLREIAERNKPERERLPAEQIFKETYEALTDPEGFLQRFDNESKKAAERAKEVLRETEKLLSPQQQYAHTLIREYLISPEKFYKSEVIGADNMGLLLLDINRAENEQMRSKAREDAALYNDAAKGTEDIAALEIMPKREQSVYEITDETLRTLRYRRESAFTDVTESVVSQNGERQVLFLPARTVYDITKRVTQRWHERIYDAPESEHIYSNEKVNLMHKATETTFDEETIENMQDQLMRVTETSRKVMQTVENHENVQKTVINNTTEDVLEKNSENIQRIVNSSLKQQIDEISDRVYGKIERQLKNEQRRRGM